MRADRLVAILMLLQHRGRLTADEIAAELEVSKRTVYTDRGRGGGISLVPGYRTPASPSTRPRRSSPPARLGRFPRFRQRHAKGRGRSA